MVSDPYIVDLDSHDYRGEIGDHDYKTAVVRAISDTKWIKDFMAMDDEAYKSDMKTQRNNRGERSAQITLTATDVLGNRESAVCNVTVKFVTDDKTTLYSSSGSGGGSGSGSSSTSGSVEKKLSSETGTWVQREENKWSYYKDGMKYADQWAYIHNPYAAEKEHQEDWFRFDEDGMMCTGWYQEEDGGWYYLHDEKDGKQGYMYTGWHVIDGKWYCFGPDGRMYYSTLTPDGYFVDASGAWIVDGEIQHVN
jgi:hypothetical protein